MNWNNISTIENINEIINESFSKKILIFKHSKRCGTSFFALNILESQWKPEKAASIKPYLLDLVTFRNISNAIEKEFGVIHESPQVLLISNGECIYTDSHGRISFNEIIRNAA